MARRGGTISAKAQIPLALALVAVLAAVVIWRIVGTEQETVDAAIAPPEALGVTAGELNHLNSLIDWLDTVERASNAQTTTGDVLGRDPFEKSETMARLQNPLAESEYGSSVDAAQSLSSAERAKERHDFLEAVEVSTTFRMGDRAKAVVNGRYVETGDTIEGFTIMEILEDSIVMADALGEAVIWMQDSSREGDARENTYTETKGEFTP